MALTIAIILFLIMAGMSYMACVITSEQKKCINCGGRMFKEKVDYKSNWGGDTVVIPAGLFKCENCGSEVFDGKEVKRIQKIAASISERKRG
jgi:YgiT-type zinc finger domain-containing protein